MIDNDRTVTTLAYCAPCRAYRSTTSTRVLNRKNDPVNMMRMQEITESRCKCTSPPFLSGSGCEFKPGQEDIGSSHIAINDRERLDVLDTSSKSGGYSSDDRQVH